MSAPINVFRTFTKRLDNLTDLEEVYTAPTNNTAIVLMAQVSNNNPPDLADLSIADPNNALVALGVGESDTRFVVHNFLVPPGTAADLLSGKLIVQENEKLMAELLDTPGDSLGVDLILSVLESRNA